MRVCDLLKKMEEGRILKASQGLLLLDLHEKRIVPVHQELRVLLYAGLLLIIAGAGWTVKTHFASLGDLAVISALSLCAAAAFLYVVRKGPGFDRGRVASPSMAFDYILFFGCAFFAMDIAYLETRFGMLGSGWMHYLLLSTLLFGALAFRYDNRLVLSMALSSLAAWFGFTLSDVSVFRFDAYWRFYAIAYAMVVFTAGLLSHRLAVKKHFFDIWLNFAIHFLCLALLAGVFEYKILSLYFPLLAAACVLTAMYALRSRRFFYMLYAMGYGYIGVSFVIVDWMEREVVLIFTYFVVSSLAVVWSVFKLSRRFKEMP